MDAWNGALTGGRSAIVVGLLIVFVGLTIMLMATIGGASSATAENIAAKVIVYGGVALIGFRLFFAR
jgi:uncharacterized membrane protein